MVDQTLNQTTARGAVLASDVIPVLPFGGLGLLNATAAQVRTYVLAGSGSQTGLSVITPSGDTTGATDTAAINTALATGFDVYLSAGVYYTNATLNINTTAQHGQRLYGAGATSSTGLGTGTTIRPTSAVTTAVQIDGTPYAGYMQSVAVDDMTFDMVNMTDVATNTAIKQVQAFDCRYSRVRTINFGTVKRSWIFNAGAYTTTLYECIGNFVEATGISDANGVTTINFINFDGNQVKMRYAGNMRFFGGAFQGTGTTKFYLRNTFNVELATDVEGTGVFLDVDGSVNSLFSRCQLQGFFGTYMTGTPAPHSMLFDQQNNYNTYPFSMGVGGFRLNNQSVAGSSSILSGGVAAQYYLDMGRTGADLRTGVAGAVNDFLSGTVAGDAAVFTVGATALWLGAAQIPQVKITSTGFNTFGTGTLQQGIVLIKPTADGDVLTAKNAAATIVFDINTTATASNSTFACVNGSGIIGYTDSFTTQSFRLIGSTGQAIFRSEAITPATDGASIFSLSNAAAAPVFVIGTNATVANSTVAINNGVILSGYSDNSATLKWSFNSANGTYKQTPTVVGSLPAAATVGSGARHFVTDANATTTAGIGAVVVGGGANIVPVYSDGTNWRIG